MNTETSDKQEVTTRPGWIFYDAECSICTRHAKLFEDTFMRRGFRFSPLQAPGVQEQLGLSADQLLSQFWILTPEGEKIGGPDAVIYLFEKVWWTQPFVFLTRLSFVKAWLTDFYFWFAKHRRCANGVCSVTQNSAPNQSSGKGTMVHAWLPCVLLLIAIPFLRGSLPSWAFMWLYAFFFVPFVNLIFFLILSLLPAKDEMSSVSESSIGKRNAP